MTALPTAPTKQYLDQSTDDPKQARSELATHVDATGTVISYLTGLFGSDGTKATARSTLSVYSQDETKGQLQSQGGVYVSTVGGTANAITLTPSPAIGAYAAGQKFTFIPASDNTGSTTINVSGLGVKTVYKNGGSSTLEAGDLRTSAVVTVEYDGTNLQLVKNITTSPAYLGTVSGTDTLTVSPSPAHTSYVTGRRYIFKAAASNTGAVTLNVNSLGAKTLKKAGGGSDLDADDVVTDQIVECVYDGTYMQVVSALASSTSGAGQVLNIRYSVSSSAPGGPSATSTWTNYSGSHALVTNAIPSATRSGWAVTLPAGTYEVHFGGSFYKTGYCAYRIYQTSPTAGAVDIRTPLINTGTGSGAENKMVSMIERFSLAASETLNLQYYVTNANTTDGWGENSTGETVTKAWVYFRKIG